MLSFIINELKSVVKYNKKVLFIIFITFVCAIFSILIITGLFVKEMYGVFQETALKRTYDITLEGIEDLRNLADTKGIYPCEEISFGCVYSGSEITGPGVENDIMWLFPEGWLSDNRQQEIKKLEQGEGFDEKSLEEGTAEVIVSREIYNEFYRQNKIGDYILILGGQFRLIGICGNDEQDLYLPAFSLKQYDKTKKSSLSIQEIDLKMQKPLTRDMMRQLEKRLKVYSKGENTIQSEFENMIFDYYMRGVKYIFLILAVYLFCAMVVSGLIRYMIGTHVYEYVIYKIYGIKNSYLIMLVFSQVFLLVSLSFLCGWGVYWAVKHWMIRLDVFKPVPIPCIFLIYAVVLLIQIAVSIPIVRKVVKASPMNRMLWGDYE